jgi:hypothetical protein
MEDEKERWQDEIRESYSSEEKQQLGWIAHHHIHGLASCFGGLNQLTNAKLNYRQLYIKSARQDN